MTKFQEDTHKVDYALQQHYFFLYEKEDEVQAQNWLDEFKRLKAEMNK